MENSFASTGTSPFNVDTIISNCFSTFTLKEQRSLKSNLEYLAGIIDKKGEFFDSELELVVEKNINKTAPKESLVVYKRRALLLTHDRFFERYNESKEFTLMAKEDKLSTLQEKEIRQKLEAERKRINAERLAVKKQNKLLEKQAKEAEKERKRAYNQAKAESKALKKD